MPVLTLDSLKSGASDFLLRISSEGISSLYGVTDGKAVGTFVELAFNSYLREEFDYQVGSAASGIDFPELNVDLKVTSIRQPQSSSPYRSASQKVYGLGYHLLIFVYSKTDDFASQSAFLNFLHGIFIDSAYTADYQTTRGLLDILAREGNQDDIDAFLQERNLPLDDIGRSELANRILHNPPRQGYLTISNALQWRLQYNRAIDYAKRQTATGIENLLR